MIFLDFHDTLSYPLFRNTNIIIRGYLDYKGVYFHSKDDYSEKMNCFFALDNIEQFARVNGNFFIVSENDSLVLVITDRINSFPVYYYENANGLVVTDRLPKGSINKENLEEFMACGFVIGSKTVYEGVFQMQAGQVLVFNKKTNEYYCENYYAHTHHPIFNLTEEQWIEELGNAIDRTMDNMIKRLRGRHVALFLSGGYDSKLIVSELKKRNYTNITCIILGSEKTKDVIVAKEIAEALDYKFVHVIVDKDYWKKKLNSGYMVEYFKKSASFSAMPYLQGIVLKDLIDKKIIPKDSVAITGNSGDVVEGNDVTHRFIEGELYSFEEVKAWIVYRHFMLNGKVSAKTISDRFNISDYIINEKILKENRQVNAEEAENIIEYFNWRERQCKYVVQDVRNYDYIIGTVEWMLPLWDNEFVDFWLKVPYELRYDRKLYYMYLGKDILPSANNKTSIRVWVDHLKNLLGNLALPLYILKAKYDYKYNDDFYFATYGLLNNSEFKEILRITKGYREPHSENIARMTARYY